jgi:hypothetical protein
MKKKNKERLKRKHSITVTLNDREYTVLKKYLKKYKIKSKAQLIREALFTHILEQFDKDYPSLFPHDEETK